MILAFKTKRDIYGNCKYIAFDDQNKTYSRHSGCIVNAVPEVALKVIRSIENDLIDAGYTEIDYMNK